MRILTVDKSILTDQSVFPRGIPMIVRAFFLVFLNTVFMAGMANSQSFNTTQLFRKGAWAVELTHDTTDGSLWCSAATSNTNGQALSLTAYDSNQLTLFIFDSRWSIPERPVRFIVDIDYSRWTMDGVGRESSVSLTMTDEDKAVAFVSEVMEGNAIAVYNSDLRRLATFSLGGSYASTLKLFECWQQIRNTDTIGTSGDPFSGVSDPF